jgi:nitrite reductase/ring-hydroxylating ferredoxin subunit
MPEENVNVALRFVGDRITGCANADDLRSGERRIVRAGLRQVAAYRDEDGQLHQLSARCTHLAASSRSMTPSAPGTVLATILASASTVVCCTVRR